MRGSNIALLFIAILLSSCSIQYAIVTIENKYFETVHTITIQNTNFGFLEPHIKSKAKSIKNGTWNFTALTKSGLQIKAKINVNNINYIDMLINEKGKIKINK